MLDYTFSDDESFILRYSISIDKKYIRLFTADGKMRAIPYSKENKEKVILKMKQQVNEAMVNLPVYERIKKRLKKVEKYNLLGLLVATIMALIILPYSIPLALIISIIAVVFEISIINLGIETDTINDLEKNSKFLEYEEEINENKSNEIVLKNIKKKTRNKLKNKVTFTINDADDLSFSELNAIIDAMNMAQEYDIQETDKAKSYKMHK